MYVEIKLIDGIQKVFYTAEDKPIYPESYNFIRHTEGYNKADWIEKCFKESLQEVQFRNCSDKHFILNDAHKHKIKDYNYEIVKGIDITEFVDVQPQKSYHTDTEPNLYVYYKPIEKVTEDIVDMKAAVIQGGGSYGAYTAGRLVRTKPFYDMCIGSSTGALIACLLAAEDWDSLGNGYTSINNEDIYTKYPFYKNGKGIPNIQNALWSLITNKKGLTDSKPLRSLISKYFTEAHYNSIKQREKQLFVTVCELNKLKDAAKYISIYDYDYETFCDYVWASTLVPALLAPMSKEDNGQLIDYCDGGTVENVGLKKAIQLGASKVDVYLHTVYKEEGYKCIGVNWGHNLIRAIAIQRQEVVDNDLSIEAKDVIINKHYMKRELTGAKIMDFNSNVMTMWFKQGMEDAIF